MSRLSHVARVLRLADEQGRLSLTNLGMIVVLVKLAMVVQTTVPDLAALFLSLAAYNGKKLIDHVKDRATAGDVTAEHVEKLQSIATAVDALSAKLQQQDTIKTVQTFLKK